MDDAELQAMIRHDEHHWWYRGRRRVLDAVLDRHAPGGTSRLLDVGCGSGRTLDELARRGAVSAVDVSPAAVQCARARGYADVQVAQLEELPYADDTFDVVTCLDVIEHTPDDRRSLTELLRVTRAGGILILTVPAHPSLWSRHDVVNRHYRRYRPVDLRTAAIETGWEVESETYFNSMLLAPAALLRRLQRVRPDDAAHSSDLELTSARLDRLLELPLIAEARLIGAGARVPFGLSLLGVLVAPASVREPERSHAPFTAPGTAVAT